MNALTYGQLLGRINDANSMFSLDRIEHEIRAHQQDEPEASALLSLIRIKRERLIGEN